MSIPNRIQFFMSFPGLISPASEFWSCLTMHLAKWKILPKTFELSQIAGHPVHLHSERYLVLSPSEVQSLIKERNLTGFQVSTRHMRGNRSIAFTLSDLWDGKDISKRITFFSFHIETQTKAPNDWSPLIESLLLRWNSFGAWQYATRYQIWQRYIDASRTRLIVGTEDRDIPDPVDKGYYESQWGAFPPGTRTYPDPNFDKNTAITRRRTLIDVTLNPGRPRKLISEISFYPSAEMWLGPHFWQYAKCKKEEVLAADFFLEKRDTPQYLYLKCWPKPFTRPDGEQGRMQQRLWKLFFHEDCEWPPGSGTICDEPMYGPPELMPQEPPPENKL